MQWPAGAAPFVGATAEALHALEIGEHVIPTPPGIPISRPGVEVGRMAADEDHGINGAGTAEYFPARPISAAVVQIGIRLGAKHPVDPGVVERLAIADRDVRSEE